MFDARQAPEVERQYASFTLDEHLFGIDILLVREIIRRVDFTPVDRAPEGVLGLLNLRGQIITVVDLRGGLGLPSRRAFEESRCIILKTSEEMRALAAGTADATLPEAVGILVDGIGDVVGVDAKTWEPAPANVGRVRGVHLAGVARLPSRLLLLLSVRSVLSEFSSAPA